ncbi:MAG: dihydroorotase [Oscillospiraceae bacterium]|nr:dihydroorotase [Oscillospiraceae bacterium]
MWDHIVKNGVLTDSRSSVRADLYIRDGVIAAISAEALPGEAAEITDAAGKLVLPGFIDSHVHSRDGRNGFFYKEDFAHSSAAGAAGGVTTILEMPNSNPAVYCADNLLDLAGVLSPKAFTDYGIWGLCLGPVNNGELTALRDAGAVALKFFWGYAVDLNSYQLIYNYRDGMENVLPPLDDGQVYQLFREAAKTGLPVAIHAENFALIRALTEEIGRSGDDSYAALLASRPAVSELTVIQTAIAFSRALGTRLHILHLAAGDGVELIRRAKQEGLPVTAETCPHYLALTDKDAERCGSSMKGYPPVRTQRDQDLLWEGVRDGTISLVCSDHAPHSPEEKLRGFREAPAGTASIETTSMVMLNAVHEGKLDIHRLVSLLSEEPARLFGLHPRKGSLQIGSDADLVVVDPDLSYTFHQEDLHSRTKLSPYDGRRFCGKVVKTILRGRTVAENGRIVGAPRGVWIRP